MKKIIDHDELGRLVEPHELERHPRKPTVCRWCYAPAQVHPTAIYARARDAGDVRSYHKLVNGSLWRRLVFGRRR